LTGFLAAVFQPLSCQPLDPVGDPVEQVLTVVAQGHLGRPLQRLKSLVRAERGSSPPFGALPRGAAAPVRVRWVLVAPARRGPAIPS